MAARLWLLASGARQRARHERKVRYGPGWLDERSSQRLSLSQSHDSEANSPGSNLQSRLQSATSTHRKPPVPNQTPHSRALALQIFFFGFRRDAIDLRSTCFSAHVGWRELRIHTLASAAPRYSVTQCRRAASSTRDDPVPYVLN